MHLHISNRNGSCTNPIDYKNNAIANAKCLSVIYQLYPRNIPQRIVAIYLVLDVGLLFTNNGGVIYTMSRMLDKLEFIYHEISSS